MKYRNQEKWCCRIPADVWNSIKYSTRNLREKPTNSTTLETHQKNFNQSLGQKYSPSRPGNPSFCTNQSKLVKFTTAECKSNLNHSQWWFAYCYLQRLCTIIARYTQQKTGPSCKFRSNQLIKKRGNKSPPSIWTPESNAYLCTTIEIIQYWKLDRYSSALILRFIFTSWCND